MPNEENISAHTIYILSAVELEDVMACTHELCARVLGAQSTVVMMWDADLEQISEHRMFGSMVTEMTELAEAIQDVEGDLLSRVLTSTDTPVSRSTGDIRVEFIDSRLISKMDATRRLSILEKLGTVLTLRVFFKGVLSALVVISGPDLPSALHTQDLVSGAPIAVALSRAWEMKELQRENERLRSQYEEIEEKTSSMEEQTLKLIHDITARDAIRMKHLERERLVYWISNAVRSSVHIKEVVDTTVEKIGTTFGVSRCLLLRAEKTTSDDVADMEVFEFCRNGVEPARELFFTEGGRAFTKLALSKETPESIEIQDLSTKATYDPNFLNLLSLRSGLIVPLIMRDTILGVLFLQDISFDRDWSIDDISLIGSLADNLSVAIENAELHQEREKQAVTDGLTGVNNRRSFNENLQKEFERARRYDQPLSLVIVDLDFLKKINDQYGHMAGDEAIRAIGGVLKLSSRSTDFVARYGGEEFCLLLPNTGIEMAEQLAERLRRKINEITVTGYGNISASLGVSNFPLHCNDAEELFGTADAALYKAKQGGRNCVKVAADLIVDLSQTGPLPAVQMQAIATTEDSTAASETTS